jgi:hypothetical protein
MSEQPTTAAGRALLALRQQITAGPWLVSEKEILALIDAALARPDAAEPTMADLRAMNPTEFETWLERSGFGREIREAHVSSRSKRFDGPVVIIQSLDDPGDMGEPREWIEDGVTHVVVPAWECWAAPSQDRSAAGDGEARG